MKVFDINCEIMSKSATFFFLNQVKVVHEKSININRLAWNFESIFMDVSHSLEIALYVLIRLKNPSYC